MRTIKQTLALVRLIRQVSRDPRKFNMGVFLAADLEGSLGQANHQCGTLACIAGHLAMAEFPDVQYASVSFDEERLGALIGLDETEADRLFYGKGAGKPMREITHPEAMKVLRYLLWSGKVDWRIIAPNRSPFDV